MKTSRRGLTVLESVVALGVIAALLAVTLKMFAATAAERRAVERRSVAEIEAANIAERISTLPWNEITSQGLAQISLSPAAKEFLPRGELSVAVEDTAAGPPGKHVRLEITWTDAAGQREAPVRLSSWTYAPQEGSPP